MGHVFSDGVIMAFGSIFRPLKGLGITVLVICLNALFINNGLSTHILRLCLESISTQWNSNQVLLNTTLSNEKQQVFGLQTELVPLLVLISILTYLLVYHGPRSIGRVSYVTAVTPVFIFLLILIVSLFNENCREGMKMVIRPDISVLGYFSTWEDAGFYSFRILGIGLGVLSTYSSYSNTETLKLKDVIKLVIFLSAGSITMGFISALTVFSGIGYSIEAVWSNNHTNIAHYSMIFSEYLIHVHQSKLPHLHSFAFFGSLFLMALNTTMALVETIHAALVGQFKWSMKNEKLNRFLIVTISCLISIPTVLETKGNFLISFFDTFTVMPALFIVAILEIAGIFAIYDFRVFLIQLQTAFYEEINSNFIEFIRPVLKIVVPMACLILHVFSLEEIFETDSGFGRNARIVGWIWSTMVSAPIVLYPLIKSTQVLCCWRRRGAYDFTHRRQGKMFFDHYIV
ncbi:hypothetical protein ACOME3_003107 [Neoechinorhynchus agilis]